MTLNRLLGLVFALSVAFIVVAIVASIFSGTQPGDELDELVSALHGLESDQSIAYSINLPEEHFIALFTPQAPSIRYLEAADQITTIDPLADRILTVGRRPAFINRPDNCPLDESCACWCTQSTTTTYLDEEQDRVVQEINCERELNCEILDYTVTQRYTFGEDPKISLLGGVAYQFHLQADVRVSGGPDPAPHIPDVGTQPASIQLERRGDIIGVCTTPPCIQ